MKRITLSIQEPTVRTLLHAILRGRGFLLQDASPCVRPEAVCNCDLECCPCEIPPDLMLLDVVIDRDCSGVEAAQKALQKWPGIKILLTSATPSDFWNPAVSALFRRLPAGAFAFLLKPFTAQELRAAVQALLDAPDQGCGGGTSRCPGGPSFNIGLADHMGEGSLRACMICS